MIRRDLLLFRCTMHVEIEWPYGKSNDTLPGFKADQFVTITEGRGVTASQQYHAR
jgi:hypothetical protein